MHKGISAKIAVAGDKAQVFQDVNAKVRERMTGMFDDSLYAYLGFAKEASASEHAHEDAHAFLDGAELLDCLGMRGQLHRYNACLASVDAFGDAFMACVNASSAFAGKEKAAATECYTHASPEAVAEVDSCVKSTATDLAFVGCIDDPAKVLAREELMFVVDDATRALAYPLGAGFGDLLADLHEVMVSDAVSTQSLLTSLKVMSPFIS